MNYLSTYDETELESDAALHEDDDEQIARTQEYLEARGLKLDEEGNVVEDQTSTLVAIVCSCGSLTCGMIERYGHPRPTYEEHVRPLPTQYQRDVHAAQLKGA